MSPARSPWRSSWRPSGSTPRWPWSPGPPGRAALRRSGAGAARRTARRAGLEDELVAGDAFRVLGRHDGQQLDHVGRWTRVDTNGMRRGRSGCSACQEVLGDEAGEGQHVGERGLVAEPGEVGLDGHARAAHRVAALAAHADDRDVAAVLGDLARAKRTVFELNGPASGRSVVIRTIRRLPPRGARAAGDPRRRGRSPGRPAPRRACRCRAARPGSRPGRLELARRDELHRPSDLRDVLHGTDPAPDVSLAGDAGRAVPWSRLAGPGRSCGRSRWPRRRPWRAFAAGSSSRRARSGCRASPFRGTGRSRSPTP